MAINPVKKGEFSTAPPSIRGASWKKHLFESFVSAFKYKVQNNRAIGFLALSLFPFLKQELDRICQQDGEVLDKFNEILSEQRGSSAVVNVDKTVEDARQNEEEVVIETVPTRQPKDCPSTKIIDHKMVSGGTVTLYKDDKHYILTANQDCKVPRGTKLASVGGGKPQVRADGKNVVGVPLAFLRGDRTWVELLVNTADGGDGDDSAKTKRGTLYSATSLTELNQRLSFHMCHELIIGQILVLVIACF